MDTLQTYSAETWDKPPSVDDVNDRPRKKRRKYIAKAWLVWNCPFILFLANTAKQ